MQPGMTMEQQRRFTDYGGGLGKAFCIALLIFGAAMTPMGTVRVQPAKVLIEESTTNETASETKAPHDIYLEVFGNPDEDENNRQFIARFMMTIYNIEDRSFGDVKRKALQAIDHQCGKLVSDRRFPLEPYGCFVPGKLYKEAGETVEVIQEYCRRGLEAITDNLGGSGAKFISHAATNGNEFGVVQFRNSLTEILPKARERKSPVRRKYTLGAIMTTNLFPSTGMVDFETGGSTEFGPSNHYFMELPPMR